ncbi:unnamed protein product, partial [Iphiclides podalirius]
MSTTDTSLGIKELSRLSKILIRQKTTKIANKYVVMAPDGSVVLHAREESGILDRMLVGTSRAFEMTLFDNDNKEVIKLRRPYTMGPDKMDVSLCGRPVSVVRKEVTFLKPVINVNDANDRPAYRVKGPVVTTNDCDFEIYTREKVRVGVIGRRWGGAGDSNGYELQLPADLDVSYKVALLGASFLIDFMYYEN